MNAAIASRDIRRVVILGHSGFIGDHLLKYFRSQSPEIKTAGFSAPALNLTKKEEVAGLADLFDLETTVIMCSGIKKQLGDNLEIFLKNLKMVVNLCDLLQDHPVQRFVYFSSADVYGEDTHNTGIREKTPLNPTSFYGTAKYASERLLQKVIGSHKGSSLLILRPPLVYGPGDRSRGYGPSGFVWAALHREKILLWGDGSERREFIFVEDLVKAVHGLTLHNYSGVVNVAGGKSYSFKDVLRIISRLSPFELQVSSRPRTREKVDCGFSNGLLVELLPGICFTSLEEGIRRTFEAECMAKNGDEDKIKGVVG